MKLPRGLGTPRFTMLGPEGGSSYCQNWQESLMTTLLTRGSVRGITGHYFDHRKNG